MHLYDEFVDFLVENVNPQALGRFQPSLLVRDRAAELASREATAALAPDERSELHHFRAVEDILRLAKARLKQRLISE